MTFGPSIEEATIQQPNPSKIEIIDDRVIVACTGTTGQARRFIHEMDKLWTGNKFQNQSIEDAARLISTEAIKNFHSTFAYVLPNGFAPRLRFGALVAVPRDKSAELIEFDIDNFQPDVKDGKNWYASMGSGQRVADPLLGFVRKAFWRDSPPNKQEGIFAATLVLTLGCQIAPIGVAEPIHMAILEPQKKGQLAARLLSDEELLEHKQSVEGAFEHLREYQAQLQQDPEGTEPPSPPKG